MLSQFLKFVKKNQADIVLIIGVILISLMSFGAGRLTTSNLSKEPLIIQEPTASIFETFETPENPSPSSAPQNQEGKFVGSIKSDKYHHPDCPFAQKISLANQIWFQSEAEAQAAGYLPCSKLKDFLNP